MKRKNKPENLISKVERHVRPFDKNIFELANRSKALYNTVIFVQRQKVFWREPVFTAIDFINFFVSENHELYRTLPAQTAQQVVIQACRSFTSWFAALRAFKKNQSSFKAKPSIPKYLRENKTGTVIFTCQQVQVKSGVIKFPKLDKFGLKEIKPIKTKIKPNKFRQVRITLQSQKFVFDIVYDDEIKSAEVDAKNFVSLDLGVNNLAAMFSNVSESSLINGRPLKSINQSFNKEKARLQSIIKTKSSHRIKSINSKRNNKVNDYLHKTSRFIINFCIENRIGTIVIGRNQFWKQESNLGSSNNQNFVQIPHARLAGMISYKAREYGITVMESEESYTSKIDHFAKEPMQHFENYLGKRIKRGLFQSSLGFTINADVNGAIGIARKAFGDSVIPIADRGRVCRPALVCPTAQKVKC